MSNILTPAQALAITLNQGQANQVQQNAINKKLNLSSASGSYALTVPKLTSGGTPGSLTLTINSGLITAISVVQPT